MLILLPPSEGKASTPGSGNFRKREPNLVDDAAAVLSKLEKLKAAERAKWYGAKTPARARETHAQNLAVLDAPCLKALERYTGVVYQSLAYPTLRAKKRAEERIWIVSALFGAVPGGTMLPDYKLSMNPALARYWAPINRERIAAAAKGKPVLDLTSQVYSRAVGYEDVIRVDFKKDGGKKSAGHFGKAIKGCFVRWLIENNVKSAAEFKGFVEEGYRFDGKDFVQR